MSSIKRVLCFEKGVSFHREGQISVEDHLEQEFSERVRNLSDSDAADQARRIDYLKTVVARLADALFQAGGLSAKQVLDLTCDGYLTKHVNVEGSDSEH